MSRIRFVKMEGAGNDYVYVDVIHQEFPLERVAELARTWSDRHYGIGSDGLILLLPSDVADVRMQMYNRDGTRGEMCGNGLRCVAKLAHDLGIARGPRLAIETDAGIRSAVLRFRDGVVDGAEVEMAAVEVAPEPETLQLDGREIAFHAGDAGNPHAVVFVPSGLDSYDVERVGVAMQSHPRFPRGVNVEFVEVQGDGSLRQRTYERGSGETLACGSGATVAALAGLTTGRVPGPEVVVHLRGGTLTVTRKGTFLVMAGPARTVFEGEVDLLGRN